MSFASTVALVARTSVLRARRRPGSWAIACAAVLPAALAGLVAAIGHGAFDEGTRLAIRLVGPLLAVALVSGPVGEQYENRTATYWMIRPIGRAAVPLGDWLGFALVLMVLMVLAGGLTVAAGAIFESSATDLSGVPRVLGALALEGLVLAGFATGLATLIPRHPLLGAIGVLTATEGLLRFIPGVVHNGSLTFAFERIAGLGEPPPAADAETLVLNALAPHANEVPVVVPLVIVAFYAVIPMLIAAQRVRERDLA